MNAISSMKNPELINEADEHHDEVAVKGRLTIQSAAIRGISVAVIK